MVWGWLPCGLVYAALAMAATTGSAINGGLTMLAFGAGTLPAVMGAGMLTGLLASAARKPHVRQAAGLLIILMAIASLGVPALMSYDSHQDHATAIIGVIAHA
jgi:sulfite exporter TauE/SafE